MFGRGHVDPRAQHPRPVGELARAHPLEEVQALLDRPVAPRAVPAGLGQRAAVLADLVRREVVDVGLARPDQVDGPRVELLEVVGRVVEVLAPVEPQPAHVRLDGVDVLLLLLDGVRVVEAQVAAAAELARDAEVEADRLGVADVQVAVRLGREAGDDRRVPAGPQVGGDDLADEVASLRRVGVWMLTWRRSRLGRGSRGTALPGGVGWRARIRTWNPLIQSQVPYRLATRQ